MQIFEYVDAGLAVKLASTALLVVVATGFAARFGAFIGAMIAAIPISAGPSYLFIAMENDAAFVAQSALTSVAINPLTVVFLVISSALVDALRYYRCCVGGRHGGMARRRIADYAIMRADLTLAAGLPAQRDHHMSSLPSTCRDRCSVMSPANPPKRGWFDIPLRVIAVVTVVGSAVDSRAPGRAPGRRRRRTGTGRLAQHGSRHLWSPGWCETCAAVLANGIVPMIGFWLGLATIHVLVEQAKGRAIALCDRAWLVPVLLHAGH